MPIYESYTASIARLKKGIPACKLNFSNMSQQRVIVYLSSDETSLCYINRDEGLKNRFFSKPRTMQIARIPSLLYGGLTSTFKKHSSRNYEKIRAALKGDDKEIVNIRKRDYMK